MWFTLAITGTFLYALVTFVDKYVVEKIIYDYRCLISISSLISLVIGFIAFVQLRTMPSMISALFLFSSGALIVLSTLIYFYVITKDHISFVTVFFQITPIFVIILANTLLSEKLTILQIFGSCLVIASGIAIAFADNYSKNFRWKISKKTVVLMLFYDLLWALAVICIKLAGNKTTLSQIITFEGLGMGLVGLAITLVLSSYRKALIHALLKLPKKNLFILVGNEGLLYFSAKLSMNYAYRLGAAGPVSIVESSQILMALLLGFGLSKINPKVFKENVDSHIFIKKVIYGLFMIFGLVFLR
ncbi:MAG: EamA family transporter [Patescibacteria group bacterium]